MNDGMLITTGAIRGTLAAICCATPLLAIALGGLGLTAWLAKADYAIRHNLTVGDVKNTMFAYLTGASDIGYML
jgi:hypothetical protein